MAEKSFQESGCESTAQARQGLAGRSAARVEDDPRRQPDARSVALTRDATVDGWQGSERSRPKAPATRGTRSTRSSRRRSARQPAHRRELRADAARPPR